MTSDQINYWRYKEDQRSNLANEKETNRHNVSTENETNRHNVTTEKETKRHNIRTEFLTSMSIIETRRHNMVTELQNASAQLEIQRANRAQEALARDRNIISMSQIGLGYAQLNETKRANLMNEALKLGSLNETIRSNQAREFNTRAQFTSQLSETHRANLAQEALAAQRNSISRMQAATDALRLTETQRHNRQSELNERRGQNYQLIGTMMRSASSMIASSGKRTTQRSLKW